MYEKRAIEFELIGCGYLVNDRPSHHFKIPNNIEPKMTSDAQ